MEVLMDKSKNSYARLPVVYRPYNLPTSFPVLTFFGENWKVTMKHPEFLHFHNCFELGFCLNGSGTIHFERYKLPFHAGQFSVINPLEPHISVCNDESSSWEYVLFDPTVLFRDLPFAAPLYQNFYPALRTSQIIRRECAPDLHAILHSLYKELRGKQSLYPYAVHSLLLLVLAELNRLPESSEQIHSSSQSAQPGTDTCLSADPKVQTVQTALLYIFSHYTEDFTIFRLSELCCLSVSQFRRVFTEIIGISPLEYLQHYRIQHACHLLLQDRIPINEIARQVGYQTLSSFNRQFQQYTGCSPSAWKKEYIRQPEPHNIDSLTDLKNESVFRY